MFESFLNEAMNEVSQKMVSIGVMNAADSESLAKLLDVKVSK